MLYDGMYMTDDEFFAYIISLEDVYI